jgi:transposase
MANEDNFKRFEEAYKIGLREALAHDAKRPPENRQYAYTVRDDMDKVVERMMRAIREKPMGVNYNSDGLYRTCKRLGISYSRKSILAYLGLA